ncbi:MAG: hypothetical protein COV66_02650 [Nitrospinae bacterium CG11_big_fil_rev_8_21_14_0_20_45_15]|nr:MAG: hypothetical protein COV66_02650 [Nitrospinae bacterium CG11_big_fil_rev_8_21_14_0_20_45_15]
MQSNSPPKLLIIDDEKEYCSLMEDFFSEEGFSVEMANSGVEGLSKVETFQPDVILLDKKMPMMGGVECLKRISAITSSPVIIVSGALDIKGRDECLDLGAYAFITKPINLDEVLGKVNSALKKE